MQLGILRILRSLENQENQEKSWDKIVNQINLEESGIFARLPKKTIRK